MRTLAQKMTAEFLGTLLLSVEERLDRGKFAEANSARKYMDCQRAID
jgi:hypothetical protein